LCGAVWDGGVGGAWRCWRWGRRRHGAGACAAA
jgi:hypothetical protein